MATYRGEGDNCIQVYADTVWLDGVPVAILLTDTAPQLYVEAFRRCLDAKDFSKAVYRERDAHRPVKRM